MRAISLLLLLLTTPVFGAAFVSGRSGSSTNAATNTTVYASNIVSGGQLPFGTVAANETTNTAGAVLVQNVDGTRRWDGTVTIVDGRMAIGTNAASTSAPLEIWATDTNAPLVRVRSPRVGDPLTIQPDGGLEIWTSDKTKPAIKVRSGGVNTPLEFFADGTVSGLAGYTLLTPSDGIALQNFAGTNDGGFGWVGAGVTYSNVTFVSAPAPNGGTENVMRMTGVGEYQRRLAWSNNWHRMKVGVLVRIPTNGPVGEAKFAATNVHFFLGVVSGTSTACTSSNTLNAVGFGVGHTIGTSYVMSSNTSPRSIYFMNSLAGYTCTNGSWTSLGMSGGSGNGFIAADPGNWSWLFIEISKPWGSQTNGVSFSSWFTGFKVADMGYIPSFRSLVTEAYGKESTTPSLELGLGNMGTATWTYSEGATALDTFGLYWANTNTVPLEVGGIMASRLY